MHEWRRSTWGEEVALEYGKAIRGYQDADGHVPVYGTNGPVGRTETPLYDGPGVILGRKGAYRGVHYCPTPFHVIDTAYYVVPKTDLDMRWLYYAIMYHRLGEIDDGSPIPSTTRAAVYVRELDVPRKDEQIEIASVLSALDNKIELNRRMNETLEAQARALFRDWFVDFGPVKAKMAGDAPYLTPDLWSLFPDRLGEDGVPEGWRAGTLDLVSSLNPESWAAKTAPRCIHYVDLANTKWGYIEATATYRWDDAPSRARRVLRSGDTIIGTVRPGNGSFAYVAEDGLTGSTGFAVLRPNNEHDRTLVWCAATNPENISRLAHLADGGAYPAVRPDVVLATPLAIPGEAALRKQFEAVAGSILGRIEHNKAEADSLAQTRDLLLPKLMSGEVRLREAEKELEEVL